MNRINTNVDDTTDRLEKQIETMLEKVLSDDEHDKITTLSEGLSSGCRLTNENSFDDGDHNSFTYAQGYHKTRPSLFKRNGVFPNQSFSDVKPNCFDCFTRASKQRPNTTNYGKSEKIFNKNNYHLLLKNNNELLGNLMGNNEQINFIPNDIFSLQLRLKLNSDENPSKNVL
jgi:hypothetical protein